MSPEVWRAALTLRESRRGPSARDPHAETPTRKWSEEHRRAIRAARLDRAHATTPPDWWIAFVDAFDRAPDLDVLPARPVGFLRALEPIIARSRNAIAAKLEGDKSALLPRSGEALDGLLESGEDILRERLSTIVKKVLVLELSVASRRGLLRADTPAQRFAFFCECLSDRGLAVSILSQYPVLVRRVTNVADNWSQATQVMFERLASCEGDIRQAFFAGGNPGVLAKMEACGDTHGRGAAVHILTFGFGQRLVYKPRPVAMEQCYANLIAWFNTRDVRLPMKAARVCDRGSFGFMEFVPAVPCDSEPMAKRFFARMGCHLALNYICGGTDLHSENVIAEGEHPVAVDLETLFHPSVDASNNVYDTANTWLATSVMRSMLLPAPRGGADSGRWTDFSALGHAPGQVTPMPVAHWQGSFTDRMKLSYARMPMSDAQSLPTLQGAPLSVSNYRDDLVEGFENAYRVLHVAKRELLADDGPLTTFHGRDSRFLCRDTMDYAGALLDSFHPRYQRDAIACEAFLHDAMRNNARNIVAPANALEDTEVESLLAGDIPYLTTRIGDPTIFANGVAVATSGNAWDAARQKIKNLGPRDLELQTLLIRASTWEATPTVRLPRPSVKKRRAPTTTELLAIATRIGHRLCDRAISDGNASVWLVPQWIDATRMTVDVADIGLGQGLSGIALFLAYLGAVTQEDRFSAFSTRAIEAALARPDDGEAPAFGAMRGFGGLCYALVHLANELQRPDFSACASRIVRDKAKAASRAGGLDLFEGMAGFLVTALVVYDVTHDASLLSFLRPIAEKLSVATKSSRMHGKSKSLYDFPGLAHGETGVALALARWAAASGDDDARKQAETLFTRDFDRLAALEAARTSPTAASNATSWCRGMIGLHAAARSAEMLPTRFTAASTADLVRKSVEESATGALCLCHGALGQLEYVKTVCRTEVGDDAGAFVDWRTRLLTRVAEGDWSADLKHTLECPSLFYGLAGTGYALLRESMPDRVPSVLQLEGPRSAIKCA